MINANEFLKFLQDQGVSFYTGVPDSLLKGFCNALTTNLETGKEHIIAANEGNAVAIATGYYLSTGKIPLVYLQNAGEGNIIDPITSLVDSKVYSIPLFLVIGWRGEPGKPDEPQHQKQGEITIDILKTLDIVYSILPSNLDEAKVQILAGLKHISSENKPYALIIRKNIFDNSNTLETKNNYKLSRENAIKIVLNKVKEKDIIVSTTGKLSRELYELRKLNNQSHAQDFLNIGAMGHTSQCIRNCT